MATAVITFAYNERVNLPIWMRYYGAAFGERNLYIVDHGSDDGSLDNIGLANRIVLPRTTLDEQNRVDFVSQFHSSLLSFYDTVIYSDCDELIVPDPAHYSNLKSYVEGSDFDCVHCVGLNLLHVLDQEGPIQFGQPLLSQRKYARFQSPICKPLIGRVPLRWVAGFHSCDKQPKFDSRLLLFHTKVMDYGVAVARHQVNQQITLSERSRRQGLSSHHHKDLTQFVKLFFLIPMDLVHRKLVSEFNFEGEISELLAGTVEKNGFFWMPRRLSNDKIVEIPERFRDLV